MQKKEPDKLMKATGVDQYIHLKYKDYSTTLVMAKNMIKHIFI